MQALNLERFSVCRLLGHGANYEVYDAIDRESGQSVVLKRPWAQALRGGQHRSVDEQSAQLIRIHHLLGGMSSHISRLVGYAERARHDRYFEDALSQEYYVLVEERAVGVPLVADIKDKFRGIPIGLGQNLFALYPLVSGALSLHESIFEWLLDVEEAFLRINHVLLDLRPQNVYFDPRRGRMTVIDLGMCIDLQSGTSHRPLPDVHDSLAELCKYYLAPQPPPTQQQGHREPFGMGPPLGSSKELDRMIRDYSRLPTSPLHDIAVDILQRVKRRDYGAVAPFRQDLRTFLAAREARNQGLQDFSVMLQAWRAGMAMFHEKYWRKFLFNPETDLVSYA